MNFIMWELQKERVYAVASKTIDNLLTRFQAALPAVNGTIIKSFRRFLAKHCLEMDCNHFEQLKPRDTRNLVI
jgi:hypothetical protein